MFAHRLARELNCTVEELDERVSSDEFCERIAFEQLSPPVGERIDYMVSLLCTIIANAWSKKRWTMKDFLPNWGSEGKRRGARTTAEIMKLFEGLPGTVVNGRPVD